TGYAKNRGKPGVKWFNRFLKDYNLIPKHLRKIGAVYGAVVHGAKNPAHLMTIARECLRHSSDNHTSPVQNYVVVNYRKLALIKIAYSYPNLKHLNIRNNKEITDISISEIARSCYNMKYLNISYCKNITDKSIYEIAES
ncbi:19053_t:CDS:2, partial [Racocetra fulgida]